MILIKDLKFKYKKDYEEYIIHSIIKSIERHGGKECLSSIILTGSFGRDEPTYSMDKDGCLILKSDIEIALVYPKNRVAVEKIIKLVSSEFKENLNLMAISELRVRKAYNFNYSLFAPRYKTLFTFDLFNGSRTIWGKDYISEKHITIDSCDIYEAKRLVSNRIGELIYIQMNATLDNIEYLKSQWKGKLILAIASAWLICEGFYISSYRGQYHLLQQHRNKIEKDIGNNFYLDYKKVFLFLRDGGEVYEVSDNNLFYYVKNIDLYFKERKICKSKVHCLSKKVIYLLKYIKSGMKYGFINYEDRILQSLIEDYWNQNNRLVTVSKVWYKVFY